MSIHNHERTLALAGIVQSCTLVNHIARGRWVDMQTLDICLDSTFILEPQNILTVYGGDMSHLRFGLRRMTSFFPKPDRQHDGELASYLFGTILLSRLLQQDKERFSKLGNAIITLKNKLYANPDMDKDDMAAELAQLYVEYISTFKRRINILGNKDILQNPLEVNRIRALLLAAIRAAILWNQVGGRMWHLWWKRQQIADLANELLTHS